MDNAEAPEAAEGQDQAPETDEGIRGDYSDDTLTLAAKVDKLDDVPKLSKADKEAGETEQTVLYRDAGSPVREFVSSMYADLRAMVACLPAAFGLNWSSVPRAGVREVLVHDLNALGIEHDVFVSIAVDHLDTLMHGDGAYSG